MSANGVIKLFLFTLSVSVYSSNLLCDDNISWSFSCWPPYCDAKPFKYNHSACTISTTGEILLSTNPDYIPPQLTYTDAISIFSNTSNYPINFTIHAIPFGGTIAFGIHFGVYTSSNGAGYGASTPYDTPQTITYEWLSHNATSYNVYRNGVKKTLLIYGNNASSITHVGFQFNAEYLNNGTVGIIFDSAQFYTKHIQISSTTTTTAAFADTFMNTLSVITSSAHYVSQYLVTNGINASDTELKEAEVDTMTTNITSLDIFTTSAIVHNTLSLWKIVVIIACVVCIIVLICACIAVYLLRKRKQKQDAEMMHAEQENNEEPGVEVVEQSQDQNSCSVSVSSNNEAISHETKSENNGNLQVKEWLENKVKHVQYYDNFIANGYDTMNIIVEINDVSYLEEIGIKSVEHQMQIMEEIIKLQQSKYGEGVTNTGNVVIIFYDENTRKATIQ